MKSDQIELLQGYYNAFISAQKKFEEQNLKLVGLSSQFKALTVAKVILDAMGKKENLPDAEQLLDIKLQISIISSDIMGIQKTIKVIESKILRIIQDNDAVILSE